ncbi:hypothetical protein J6590_058326 [Homalodisca vitripennis]|nr:hypothetical protein J6590_058326 [Homalodisca vitripennis]
MPEAPSPESNPDSTLLVTTMVVTESTIDSLLIRHLKDATLVRGPCDQLKVNQSPRSAGLDQLRSSGYTRYHVCVALTQMRYLHKLQDARPSCEFIPRLPIEDLAPSRTEASLPKRLRRATLSPRKTQKSNKMSPTVLWRVFITFLFFTLRTPSPSYKRTGISMRRSAGMSRKTPSFHLCYISHVSLQCQTRVKLSKIFFLR